MSASQEWTARLVILATLLRVGPLSADTGPELNGSGTPLVDGVLSPGERDSAGHLSLRLPFLLRNEGGSPQLPWTQGTVPPMRVGLSG